MRRRDALTILLASVAALVSLASSCELLRISPFKVVAWTPGEGRHERVSDIAVSVTFSEEPHRPSVESAFSLTEDGTAVSGAFEWSGPKLSFMPCCALRPNADYRIAVAIDARNDRGVSMDGEFEQRFSTKGEDGRPSVVSTYPSRGGIIVASDEEVSITFSEAIDPQSFRAYLSLSPTISGYWSLSEDGMTASFSPLEDWSWATEYEATVSADARDASHNRMGERYSFRFTIGDDSEAPSITSLEAIDGVGAQTAVIATDSNDDATVTENAGWEGPWRLRFSFSEPVLLRTLESRTVCEGGPALELETIGEESGTAVFKLKDWPAWGERFSIRVRSGVTDSHGNATETESLFRFIADGPRSRPPRLVGMRLPLAPGEALPENRILAAFDIGSPFETIAVTGEPGHYPIGTATATAIELYFELAPGETIDRLSLMGSFRYSSTNGAMDFSAARVAIGGLAYAAPYAPWASYAVARIDGTLTNHVDSGIVTISLSAGFKDSAGNAAAQAQSLALLK